MRKCGLQPKLDKHTLLQLHPLYWIVEMKNKQTNKQTNKKQKTNKQTKKTNKQTNKTKNKTKQKYLPLSAILALWNRV